VKILSDLDVFGKRVFVRADLDVPLREAQVVDGERLTTSAELEISTRLTNLKPTIDYLLEHEVSQIIIAGHIDRPSPRLRSGKPVIDPALSTKQLLPVLEKILKSQIAFYPDVSTQPTPGVYQVDSSGSGLVVLLENLRFWPGEEANDLEFARQLASMADVYINDALSVSHREHASVVALPSLLPHAVGLHLQEEIEVLSELLKNPQRPFVAIVGGAKVSSKLGALRNLLSRPARPLGPHAAALDAALEQDRLLDFGDVAAVDGQRPVGGGLGHGDLQAIERCRPRRVFRRVHGAAPRGRHERPGHVPDVAGELGRKLGRICHG